MPQTTPGTEGEPPFVPSMLDLVRLSRRLLFPPGGVDLYRQIALLTGMKEGDEVLDVASGRGIPLEYFVTEYGVHGSGVEEDPRLVEESEARSRQEGLATRLQFQTGRCDALPYRDDIFDVAVGELGMAAQCDPATAIGELVRVTKPGGTVVLVQLVWKSPVDEQRQEVLSKHLGSRPMMLVQWKRLLRDAGVEDLYTEEWTDGEMSLRPRVAKPFPDFAEVFTLSEKVGILRRAWRRWGWRGVRTVLEREREVHQLLTRERILGLDLIKGRKREESPPTEEVPPEEAAAAERAPESTEPPDGPEEKADDDGGTAGLPLFGGDEKP